MLGRVYQAFSTRAFQVGQLHCNSTDSAILGRLHSASIASYNTLEVTKVDRFNPIFLPKVVFHSILQLLDSYSLSECLGVSQSWKARLESRPSLFRDLDLRLTPGFMNFFAKSPFELFSRRSRDRLESLSIEFTDLEQGEIDECFESLHGNHQYLKYVDFSGTLERASVTSDALELIENCTRLLEFSCWVDETFTRNGDGWEGDGFYDFKDKFREKGEIHLTSCQSFPTTIVLSVHEFNKVDFGDFEVFSRAKVVKLRIDQNVVQGLFLDEENEEAMLTHRDLGTLLHVSRQTLESLDVFHTDCFVELYRRRYKSDWDTTNPIKLPKLKNLRVKVGRLANQERFWEIGFMAPRLEDFHCNVPKMLSRKEK